MLSIGLRPSGDGVLQFPAIEVDYTVGGKRYTGRWVEGIQLCVLTAQQDEAACSKVLSNPRPKVADPVRLTQVPTWHAPPISEG
jgi:hypothetical protein